MSAFVYFVCYMSAGLLAVAVIFAGNNLTRQSCPCLKACLALIMLGMLGLVMTVFYEQSREIALLCVLPLAWGAAGWLIFSGCQSHDWKRRLRTLLQLISIRRIFKNKVSTR